jgi:hypothetical protein
MRCGILRSTRNWYVQQVYDEHPEVTREMATDIVAVYDRDPACEKYSTPLLNFKGFQALQAYRVTHCLWTDVSVTLLCLLCYTCVTRRARSTAPHCSTSRASKRCRRTVLHIVYGIMYVMLPHPPATKRPQTLFNKSFSNLKFNKVEALLYCFNEINRQIGYTTKRKQVARNRDCRLWNKNSI